MKADSKAEREGVTRRLARFISEVRYDDLPPEVVARAKLSFLDWLGAALAGRDTDSGRKVCGLVEELGGPPEATVIGRPVRRPALHAALANGVMAAVHEVDDVHLDCRIHGSLPIVSAVFALGEREEADGRRLIEAVVVGYEVIVRTIVALGIPHNQWWHSTGTAGAVGATAAACKLLGLSPERIAGGLGLGATQGAGIIDGTEGGALGAKHFHGAKAAQNGIWAALLARRDFWGSPTVLEGEWGFFRAFAKGTEEEMAAFTEGLGERWAIMRSIVKPFACCLSGHAAIWGVMDLVRENDLSPDAVESVETYVHPSSYYMIKNPDPRTPLQAKFSLPFCAAAAVARRDVSLRVFAEENLSDPVIRSLTARTRVGTREDMERIQSFVRIRTADGRVLERLAERRSVELGDIREKFRGLAEDALPPARVEEVVAWADALETHPSVGSLSPILVG